MHQSTCLKINFEAQNILQVLRIKWLELLGKKSISNEDVNQVNYKVVKPTGTVTNVRMLQYVSDLHYMYM